MNIATIEEVCFESAWKAACALLLTKDGLPYVTVVSFGTVSDVSPAGIRKYDAAAKAVDAERPSSVASVLMPLGTYLSNDDAPIAIERGLRSYGRARRRVDRFSAWVNTYFERLAGSWYNRAGQRQTFRENKLETLIGKLAVWETRAESVFYIHTAKDGDGFRKRGSPCLQYVQVRSTYNDDIELVALYRAHDYFNKFLGNAIGLQRLGEYIARKTGKTLTRVTIISLNPYHEKSKTKLNDYVAAV